MADPNNLKTSKTPIPDGGIGINPNSNSRGNSPKPAVRKNNNSKSPVFNYPGAGPLDNV